MKSIIFVTLLFAFSKNTSSIARLEWDPKEENELAPKLNKGNFGYWLYGDTYKPQFKTTLITDDGEFWKKDTNQHFAVHIENDPQVFNDVKPEVHVTTEQEPVANDQQSTESIDGKETKGVFSFLNIWNSITRWLASILCLIGF